MGISKTGSFRQAERSGITHGVGRLREAVRLQTGVTPVGWGVSTIKHLRQKDKYTRHDEKLRLRTGMKKYKALTCDTDSVTVQKYEILKQ